MNGNVYEAWLQHTVRIISCTYDSADTNERPSRSPCTDREILELPSSSLFRIRLFPRNGIFHDSLVAVQRSWEAVIGG